MKEDIKKLQKLIDRCKECKFATCEQCEINWTEVQAIGNLLARYKELEKENKILKSKQTKIITDSFHEKMAQKFNEEFITKKRVKEKIEELENDPNNIEEHNCLRADTCYVINILQELIKD